MIMLSTAQARDYSDVASTITAEQAGSNTQAPYGTVDDVDANVDRARAAVAEIIMEPSDSFACHGNGRPDPKCAYWAGFDPNPVLATSPGSILEALLSGCIGVDWPR
jgi:uncharacterized glyoxalase superfamily protein PhnB